MKKLLTKIVALSFAALLVVIGYSLDNAPEQPTPPSKAQTVGSDPLIIDLEARGFQVVRTGPEYSSDARRSVAMQYWARLDTTVELTDYDEAGTFQILTISNEGPFDNKWGRVWCSPAPGTALALALEGVAAQAANIAAGDYSQEPSVPTAGIYRLIPNSPLAMPCYGQLPI
ncbi:MAG TPA: hypothetical protein VFZ58_04285 [Candidatus Saccharimonadales bacterium]